MHGNAKYKQFEVKTPYYNLWCHKRMNKAISLDISFEAFKKLVGPIQEGMRLSNSLEWVTPSKLREDQPKSPKTKNQFKGVVEKVTKQGRTYWYCTYGQSMIKGSMNHVSAEDASRWRKAYLASLHNAI